MRCIVSLISEYRLSRCPSGLFACPATFAWFFCLRHWLDVNFIFLIGHPGFRPVGEGDATNELDARWEGQEGGKEGGPERAYLKYIESEASIQAAHLLARAPV